jgi:membrane protein insertase, YidC/Oxa1 family, C-terminal domain
MFEALYLVLIAPIRLALLFVLEQAYGVTDSYGFAIIALSLAFNLALLPAYHLAEKVQNRERKIQRRMAPKIEEFKFAFKGEERYWMMRALYRQHGYHPVYALRGLLPLAIQIPFFVATFGLLSDYEPLVGESFMMIQDLGRPDHLLFGINILPILMTALNLLAVHLYARQLPRQEKIQSYVIALVFLVLLYRSPAGLVLYWTINNMISVFKSSIYSAHRTKTFSELKPC